MNALVFLLFCIFVPIIQSCLVIRYVEPPKCNCPVLALDNSNIKSHVADHSFYSNISSRPIKAPIVSIDDCYGSVYCEGDYILVVFDTETATNFGEYAADGLCDRYTQTWLVDDGNSGGFRTFHRLYATCVDYNVYDSCKPADQPSLLFAYSNDLDRKLIPLVVDNFLFSGFKIAANVRFDVQQEEKIEYHNLEPDVKAGSKAWERSISLHPPDPSLSFASKETGSDVLKVVEKFLDNTEIPICGAKIVIILKRYPNEVDIRRLVQKLRKSHVWVYIFASTSPSGGYQKDTLYNLAAQTNGYCLFDTDDGLYETIEEVDPSDRRPLGYAVNRQVSGHGIKELPPLNVPRAESYFVSISFHDTVQSYPYSRVTFRWKNTNSSEPGSSDSTDSKGYLQYGGAEHGQYWLRFYPGVYKFWLEYNYADDKLRTIQIRMLAYDDTAVWLPYDN